jgi:hypothetical protein
MSEARISKKRVATLSGSKVARMATVAANAVRNFDLSRAIEVLDELRRMGEGDAIRPTDSERATVP